MFTHQETSGSDGLFPARAESAFVDCLRPAADPVGAGDVDMNPFESEEVLILDHRAHLGPAQQVENKLSTMLGGGSLPISHVRMLAQLGSRSHC